MIIPRKGVVELRRAIETREAPCEIGVHDGQLRAQGRRRRLSVKLIDGAVPALRPGHPQGQRPRVRRVAPGAARRAQARRAHVVGQDLGRAARRSTRASCASRATTPTSARRSEEIDVGVQGRAGRRSASTPATSSTCSPRSRRPRCASSCRASWIPAVVRPGRRRATTSASSCRCGSEPGYAALPCAFASCAPRAGATWSRSTLVPGPAAVNVLSGDNGQGKTNILEAAYYLAALRSFRTSHAEDLIRRGGAHDGARGCAARRRCTAGSSGGSRSSCGPDGTRRAPRRQGGARRGGGSSARVSVVLFVPEDLLLPRAAPGRAAALPRPARSSTSSAAYYDEAQRVPEGAQEPQRPAQARAGRTRAARRPTTSSWRARARASSCAGGRWSRRWRRCCATHFRALHSELPGRARATAATRTSTQADDEDGGRGRAARWPGAPGARWTSGAASPASGPTPTTSRSASAGAPARSHASQGQLRSLVLALKLAELTQRRGAAGRPAGAAARRRSERARSGAPRAAVRRRSRGSPARR